MNSFTAREAKARFDELLDRVAQGEQIVITRYEERVARMVPEGERERADIQEAVAGLRQLQEDIRRRTHGEAKLSDVEVLDAVNEGRP